MNSPPPPNELLEAALSYAARGWPIVPLHAMTDKIPRPLGEPPGYGCDCHNPKCKSPGKHPRTKRGLSDASTNPATIAEWWRHWPTANVGIVTGAAAGIVVIDIDPRHNGHLSLAELEAEYGELAPTLEATTGGSGRHLVYRHPGGKIGNRSGIRPGIDVRGDGGYIVAAPSNHISGGRYAWPDGHAPGDIEPAELPAWLHGILTRPAAAPRPATPAVAPAARLMQDAGRYAANAAGATEGARNSAAFNLAGHLAAFITDTGETLTECQIIDLMRPWNHRNAPPLDEAELVTAARSAMANGTPRASHLVRTAPQPRSSGAAAPSDGDDDTITVGWVADRLIQEHGERLRYNPQSGQWYLWDGLRWAHDELGHVSDLAAQTLRAIRLEAVDERDESRRKAMFAIGGKCDSAAGYQQVIATAATRPAVCVRMADIDADPWALNVQNGTVDLRTGKLRPHNPADLLTRICGAEYQPDARHELWDSFLDVVLPDEALRSFVQRAVGYSIAGGTSEEVLFMVQGPTASGKSTFADGIKETLNDYAAVADFETFLARPTTGGPRNDIARLVGKRVCISLEVDEGAKLAQGLVKTVTGSDVITARFLYREAFEFRPSFKLWLVCNHAPRVSHDDDAIWRRILLLPFHACIPEERRDPNVKVRLRTDPAVKAAILAWAVQGCLTWQRAGLRPPDAVRVATDKYRHEQDELADFISDACESDPGHWTASRELRAAYEAYCNEAGILRPLSPRMFWPRLAALGYAPETRNRQRGWRGIRPACYAWNTCNTTFDNLPNMSSREEVTESGVSGVSAVAAPVFDPENAGASGGTVDAAAEDDPTPGEKWGEL